MGKCQGAYQKSKHKDDLAGIIVCLFAQIDPHPDSPLSPASHELQHHRGAVLHWLDR